MSEVKLTGFRGFGRPKKGDKFTVTVQGKGKFKVTKVKKVVRKKTVKRKTKKR